MIVRVCRLFLIALLLLQPAMIAHAEEGEEKPKAEKADKPEKTEDGGEKPEKGGKKGKEEPGNDHYVHMMPMVLPVIGDNGPEQLVTLMITLEIDNPDNAKLIKDRMPRLTDAYMQKLYGALDRRMVTRGSLLDVELVKKQLDAPTIAVLGPGIVTGILVQSIAQRRL